MGVDLKKSGGCCDPAIQYAGQATLLFSDQASGAVYAAAATASHG